MTPSRLTASLVRGRVGSISPATFTHVIRLVQSEYGYDTEQRSYSKVRGQQRSIRTRSLRAESSHQASRRAGIPCFVARGYVSPPEGALPEFHEAVKQSQRSSTLPETTAVLAKSDDVFRFWTDDADAIAEIEPNSSPGGKKKKQGEAKGKAKAKEKGRVPILVRDEPPHTAPVVRRVTTAEMLTADPENPLIKRAVPRYVRSTEDEEMQIRMPVDRRSQMTRLDGRMEYDRRLKRYSDLDGPPRIPNQGFPTNDPKNLTGTPNWYKFGYQLGNTRKVQRSEDKLGYLNDTRELEPDRRKRLQDIRRILRPKQGVKRFGRPSWSTDPLSTRFVRRQLDALPSHRRREVLEAVHEPPSPSNTSVIPRNRYSSRRHRSHRTSQYFPSSTIYSRLPSRRRRKRIRVRLRRSRKMRLVPPSAAVPDIPEQQSPTPHFLDAGHRPSRFTKLQDNVISGAVKLFVPSRPTTSDSRRIQKGSLDRISDRRTSPRPITKGEDRVRETPPFPVPIIAPLHRTLDSPDFIGLPLDSATCIRLLDPSRVTKLTEDDTLTIAAIAEHLANPSISIDTVIGMDSGFVPGTSTVPGTITIEEFKDELVDDRGYEIAELIAILNSTTKGPMCLGSTKIIRWLVQEFQRLAGSREWLWIAGQIVDMLQAVVKSGQRHFEPSLFPVAYSVVGLALARSGYGQSDQDTVQTLHRLSRAASDLAADMRHEIEDARSSQPDLKDGLDASTEAIDEAASLNINISASEQGNLAVSAAHLGDWEAARSRMALALSLNFTISETYPSQATNLLLEYYELLASNGRLGDLAHIVFASGPTLQQPLMFARDSVRRNFMLCRIFYIAIADIDRPVDWLDKTFGWTDGYDPARVMFTVLTRFTSRADQALELAERMYTHGIYSSINASARLCGSLFRLGRHEDAHTLYGITRARNERTSHQFLSAMLQHFTDAGLLYEAKQVYDEIVDTYGLHWVDSVIIPRKLAQQGRPEETLQALRSNFGPTWAEDRRLLNILSRAHHKANDIKGAERLHQRMLDMEPGTGNYNGMIELYAKQGDSNSALAVFRRLLESEISPDIRTFELLVRMFADRKDLSNVSLLLDAMSKAEIKPNDRILALVIQAHVDSSNWLGAAACWRSIPPHLQSAPRVSAAILRAFVMLGTPPNIIFSIFGSIQEPDATHWSLLLLSYCDAGQMESAANVFATMDLRSRNITQAPAPDLYTFSILLYGYLRQNQPESARETFDEMLRRHVMPDSVTYAMIIQSFLTSGDTSLPGLGRVHRFAMSIYDTAKKGGMVSESGNQIEAVRKVFTGMITAAGNAGEIQTAQAYFDVAVPNPKKPKPRDLETIGRLMDAYRKQKDTENVLKMWRIAFDAAMELRGDTTVSMASLSSKTGDDLGETSASPPSNLLCVSLSIVMSALADVGRYTRLKEVWNEVRMEGFGLSPQNFNDYAVALVHCGDVEGAFYVVDKVLVPRDRKLREQREASMKAVLSQSDEVDGSGKRSSVVTGVSGDLVGQGKASVPASTNSTQVEATEEEDVEGPAPYRKDLPLSQRLPAALRTSEMVEEGDTYDPALFGTAQDFAQEGPPAVATTIPRSRPPLSHRNVPNARDRSDLMAKQEAKTDAIPQPAEGVPDLVEHLLTHMRPEDPSWRVSRRLWETIDVAYRDLQRQRKELAEQVATSRLALISPAPAETTDTLNLSTEKRLDEIDPRRQPREMALARFNNVLVRDRHGRPMKSTPVVVLWRLNAIYPSVVRGIYRHRKENAGHHVQDSVAYAEETYKRQGVKHQRMIEHERARLMESSPGRLDEHGEARLAEMDSTLRQERERTRQGIMDRISIPSRLARDGSRYGMTATDADDQGEDGVKSGKTLIDGGQSQASSGHDRRTSEAIAKVKAYQKEKSDSAAERLYSRPPRPNEDSVLRHGRKRVSAQAVTLTPRTSFNRMGINEPIVEARAIDRFANLVVKQHKREATGEQELEARAGEAKQRLKEVNYGEMMEEFRVRKMRLQDSYRRVEEEEKQRASG